MAFSCVAFAGGSVLSACALRRGTPSEHARVAAAAEAPPRAPADGFREQTTSPWPGAADGDLGFCGESDVALARAAAKVLRFQAKTEEMPDAQELAFFLRAEGEPHVWPHAWTLSAADLASEDVPQRLHRFLASFAEGGVRRCGIARTKGRDGSTTLGVVVVDALADLAPLPTRGRVGQWLRFEATLLVPASRASLVVLGPGGPPHSVPTALESGRVHGTFALDRPGAFTVQLVVVTDEGPRPVLDAMVFADTEPPPELTELTAPGESAAGPVEGEGALFRMVNGARTAESRRTLARSDALDRIALAHAEALARLGRLSHDAGDGDPEGRVRHAGLEPRRVGENVAHARSLTLAHRLLWASPSHRENVLDARFDSLGVGVARGPDGSLWVCELFADFGEAGIL